MAALAIERDLLREALEEIHAEPHRAEEVAARIFEAGPGESLHPTEEER